MALVPIIYDPSMEEALFALITISSADGSTPLRIVNNNETVVSRGNTFEIYPFRLVLPADTGEGAPTLRLTIDNVDLQIVEIIRELRDPPTLKIELVFSNAPDVVEKSIDFLRLVDVEYDATAITATLEPFNILMLPAIDAVYDGDEWPDLVYQ